MLKLSRFSISFFAIVLLLAGVLNPAPVFVAGCLHYEPDRDGDGVVDEKDPYPDDPTRSKEAERFPSVRITYIPSTEAVEGDVDEFSIDEKSPVVIWVFENKAVTDSLKKVVDKEPAAEPGAFDQSSLRLKLEFPKDQMTFYVDKAGVVAKDEEPTFTLSQEEFKGLEKSILALRGIVDLKENKNLCQELPVEEEGTSAADALGNGKPSLQFAMIPFSAAEVGTVGVKDISDKAQITIVVYQNPEITTSIRSLFQGPNGETHFGPDTVRFQADFPSDNLSIVVDKDGGINQNGEPKSALSADELKFLEDQANAMRGVVDMRVQAGLCSIEE